MYGINVVNFLLFLVTLCLVGQNTAITVTKTRHETFGLWDFLLKKVALEDSQLLIVGQHIALMLFVTI